MNHFPTSRRGLYKSDFVRRLVRWLDALPHPTLAIEIGSDRISGARWSSDGEIGCCAVVSVPPGAIVPSAVDKNIVESAATASAIAELCKRLDAKDESVALLLPDPVLRVFILPFDDFPRSPEEAIPLLRWKIKKSIPFDVEETVVSYMRQSPKKEGVEIVVVLGKRDIVREYEALIEAAGLKAAVVQSSSLAAAALLIDARPTLMARISGNALTTAIIRDEVLCTYRCTELPSAVAELSPQILLQEIFPTAAYYQDTSGSQIEVIRVGGLGGRFGDFCSSLEQELQCKVSPLLQIEAEASSAAQKSLFENELEALAGWKLAQVHSPFARNVRRQEQ